MPKPLLAAIPLLPSNAALNHRHVIFLSRFDTPIVLNFGLLFFNKSTLRAERNHPASIALELDAPWRVATPLVPGKPLFLFSFEFGSQLWPNDFLEPLGSDDHVVAVSIHLDQLEVVAVDVPIQEIIVKFQLQQLGQLVHCNTDLKRSFNDNSLISSLQLKTIVDVHGDRHMLALERKRCCCFNSASKSRADSFTFAFVARNLLPAG